MATLAPIAHAGEYRESMQVLSLVLKFTKVCVKISALRSSTTPAALQYKVDPLLV